jgi:hypothetical protein
MYEFEYAYTELSGGQQGHYPPLGSDRNASYPTSDVSVMSPGYVGDQPTEKVPFITFGIPGDRIEIGGIQQDKNLITEASNAAQHSSSLSIGDTVSHDDYLATREISLWGRFARRKTVAKVIGYLGLQIAAA